MENTSYQVKPELYHHEKKEDLTYIDYVKVVTRYHDRILIQTNINQFYLTIYESGIIRFTTYNEYFDLSQSMIIEDLNVISDFKLELKENHTMISYFDIDIKINHKPFKIGVYKNKKMKFVQESIAFLESQTYLFLNRHRDDFIYGLGEKTGFLNKNNEKTVNWNKDVFEPHTRSNKELYQSINMYSYLSKDCVYGLFIDNPGKITFDFDTYEEFSVTQCDIGKLDYYVYTGDTLKEIIIQHAQVTGKTYLPPLWALGYHQSRHSYESLDVLLDVYHNFKERNIPVDAIYLDILYMDRYKVFTFNEETFPNVSTVIKKLKDEGVKIVPIVDPGVKIEKGYSIYEDGLKKDFYCKNKDESLFQGEVWPGECVFYDFLDEQARLHWGQNHKFYTDLGIEGIWNDMNEPSVFNTEQNTIDLNTLHHVQDKHKTHREVHNLYGLGMSMATYEGLKKLINKRPFVLTRAGYAGIQKYATVWTGDNRSSWEHLEMTIPMCLNLSMSGVSLIGPDIGGFMDDCNEELLIRWTQLGAFLPFFRNHSSIGIKRQEPWQFGKRCENIVRKYINLRYSLIRYIYSEVFKSHQTGIPVMRPLVLEYEDDKKTYSIHDQFMLGDYLLVAPILRPGENCRKVYLPKGTWYNFFTNEKIEGNQYIIADATLEEIPLYVKEHAIIPTTSPKMNTSKLTNEITVNVYTNKTPFEGHFIIDDGISFNYQNGDYTVIHVEFDGENINIEKSKENKYQIKVNKI